MSIKKTFLPDKGVCRVLFSLPEGIDNPTKKVAIAGDFNNWNPEVNFMKMTKAGKFHCKVDLLAGREYQFRYLLDNIRWVTDWDADGLIISPDSGTYNSLIKL